MKTYEQLMNLRSADFLFPNPVLCYGAGEMLKACSPYLMKAGINIVGVIDKNRNGQCKFKDKILDIYTPLDALRKFGKDVPIIITLGKEKIIQEVEKSLTDLGFNKEIIYDLNVYSWLMVPSKKSYCRRKGAQIYFSFHGITECCVTEDGIYFLNEWFFEGRDPASVVENIARKYEYYHNQARCGMIPLWCKGCFELTENEGDCNDKIQSFFFSDNTVCNADCVYCPSRVSTPRSLNSVNASSRHIGDLVETIDLLRERGLFDENTTIEISGGEISIIPQKNKVYEAMDRMPNVAINILTNGIVYDSEIARIMSRNPRVHVQCDLDAGTPETYVKVKGLNKFYEVRENLKKYTEYGRVILKYIILPGFNDTEEDFEGTIKLLNYLNRKEIVLSSEFEIIKNNDPFVVRASIFAAAKFMKLLKAEGIEAILRPDCWGINEPNRIKRMCNELEKI